MKAAFHPRQWLGKPDIAGTGALRKWLLFASLFLAPLASLAQTNFAVLINDGAWTWFNDPRAVFHNGLLYFSYVRDADGRTALNWFNLQSGQTANLWTSSLTQIDDHNVAGLLVKQDQTMLAIYSRHQSDQFFTYRLSSTTNPMTPASWGGEQTDNTGTTAGSGMTYANPFQLTNESGKVYNFARYLNYNPNVFTSTDGGATWSTPQIVIQTGSGSTRPYVKYCSDQASRIDLLYTDAHPDNFTTSLYHLYYSGGAFYKTDGAFVKNFSSLPILHDSGERGTVVYQYNTAAQADPDQWIPNGRAWCWEIAYQTNGNPVCVFQVKVDNVTGASWFDARIYYYYARWTGTNWQKRFIAQAGRPLYNGQPDYGGGIALDPLDVNTVYLSTDAANPLDLSTTTTVPLGNHYEILKGVTTDGGQTFAWQNITPNSTVDNLRPYVPRRFGGEPCVLWFRGTYTSYTDFGSAVVGLFTTAVPQTNAASGTWNADADGTWSDDTKWESGIIGTGAGNTANFSTLDITTDRTITLDSTRTLGVLRFGDTSGSQNWLVHSSGGSILNLHPGSGLSAVPGIFVNNNLTTLQLTLTGTNGLTKNGPGTLVLAASNSLSGPLYLDRGADGNNNDGATRVTSTSAIANFSTLNIRNTSVNSAGGATLQLDGSAGGIVVTQLIAATCKNNATTPTIESLAGTNLLTGTNFIQVGGTNMIYQSDAGSLLQIAAPVQYIGTLSAARTFTFTGSGDIVVAAPLLASSNGAPITLMKSGAGTLTLSAANTYTNGTVVNNGALVINGSISNRVTLNAGSLGGTGTIFGSVTGSASATLSPGGNSFGAFTVNNSLTNPGNTTIRLGKSGNALTNDNLRVLASCVLSGTLNLTNAGPDLVTAGDSFKLFSAANYRVFFSSIQPPTPGTNLFWNTNNLGLDGTLAIALGNVNPKFTTAMASGTNFVLSGAGGAAGYAMAILFSTNLTLPMTNWSVFATVTCDSAGAFTVTNAISPSSPPSFYTIRVP